MKKDKPMISVVMPAYNAEATVARSIASVLEQTYNNFELIVVDDGSTDNTYNKCKQIADFDSRVRLFGKKNGGPGAAREYAMQYVSGDYIAFIDADDYYDNILLTTVMDIFIKDENCDIIEFNYREVDEYGKKMSVGDVDIINEVLMGDDSLRSYISQENTTNFLWNKVFKRKLFNKVVFPHLKAGEDSAVLTQLFFKSKKVVRIDTVLYHYVQTETSLVRAPWSSRKLDQIDAEKFINDFVQRNKPELSNYALQTSCSRLAGMCYELFLSTCCEKKNKMKLFKKAYDIFCKSMDKKEEPYISSSIMRRIGLWLFTFSPLLYCIMYRIRKAI